MKCTLDDSHMFYSELCTMYPKTVFFSLPRKVYHKAGVRYMRDKLETVILYSQRMIFSNLNENSLKVFRIPEALLCITYVIPKISVSGDKKRRISFLQYFLLGG